MRPAPSQHDWSPCVHKKDTTWQTAQLALKETVSSTATEMQPSGRNGQGSNPDVEVDPMIAQCQSLFQTGCMVSSWAWLVFMTTFFLEFVFQKVLRLADRMI